MGVPFIDKQFQQAQQHHMAGQTAEAERLYRKVLSNQPAHAGATHFLGLIAHQSGRSADAEPLMRRSIALDSRRAEYHNNLGEVLRTLGRANEAIESFKRGIVLSPTFADCYSNVAITLFNQRRYAEAIPWSRKALELRPDLTVARFCLAHALGESGQIDEAKGLWKHILERDPGDPEARYALASLEGSAPPPASPESFVVRLFNGYAANFDEHLVGGLGYNVPQVLRQAIDQIEPGRRFDIIDLGCGTGLVGAAFRDRAQSLVGVDLAPAMIEKSNARGVYDELERGELIPFLRARPVTADLVLAGDVFIYVGDLTQVFATTFQSLRAGGLFAFSIERHDGDGYILRPSRRYAHSRRYIETLAANNGFTVAGIQEVPLRRGQGEQMILGSACILRRQ